MRFYLEKLDLNNIQISVNKINEMELALTAFNSKRSLYTDKTNLIVKKMGSSILLKVIIKC